MFKLKIKGLVSMWRQKLRCKNKTPTIKVHKGTSRLHWMWNQQHGSWGTIFVFCLFVRFRIHSYFKLVSAHSTMICIYILNCVTINICLMHPKQSVSFRQAIEVILFWFAFCYIICNIINLFNFFTDKVKLAYNNSMDKAYKALLNNVNQTLLESGYSQVNLAGLFFSLNRPKNEKTPT